MRRWLAALAGVVGCAARIPEPPAVAAVVDEPAPSALRVCWVEYAQGTLPRGAAVAHGALKEDAPGTFSGLLVQGPRGTWLIDGGPSAHIDDEVREVHGLARVLLDAGRRGWTPERTPAEALAALRVGALTGTIATHAHYDHLGGLLDLPDAPLYVGAGELSGPGAGVLPAEGRALAARARPLPFTDTPFLLWDQSFDVFRDGSMVAFPMPGHTPGSVGVRVRLPTGRALLLVGDTVWVREGYEAREPKGWIASGFDADGAALDGQIARLWQLHRQQPELVILPAHDRRAWAGVFGRPGCL